MKKVTIYCDGACQGNPGPGGWGALLIHGQNRKELSGACPATTNNRMELTGAIEALRALKAPCEVDLYTDSQYVQLGMRDWLLKWKAAGWRRGKKPVKNLDLWQTLDAEAARHTIRWHWVRGHNDNPGNERCDQLATAAIDNLRAEIGHDAIQRALRDFLVANPDD